MPTVPERRVLLRELKARALGGDVTAGLAVVTAELADELRRARRATTAPEQRTPC